MISHSGHPQSIIIRPVTMSQGVLFVLLKGPILAMTYLTTFFVFMVIMPALGREDVYLSPQDFLAETFDNSPPEAQTIWIKGDLKKTLKSFYPHSRPPLRTRYWRKDQKTAWILEEIGKEAFITTGIVVHGGKIERIKVLIYRESRGWEVRRDAFGDQFIGAGFDENGDLDRSIDGISGATLSVHALTGLAQAALTLDKYATDLRKASGKQ